MKLYPAILSLWALLLAPAPASAAPPNTLPLERTVSLHAGEIAMARLTASAPQGTKVHFEGRPADTHYPLGSVQEFVVQPLPTSLVAVQPAAADGEYHLQFSGNAPLTVQSLEVTVQKPEWLKDAAQPSLHAADVSALPHRWLNAQGKYLQSTGGTVVLQMTPTWIAALKGGRGGLFDAYVALRMTADKDTLTTYFMIQPPGTDADNASWERSHWKLEQQLVIGTPPDNGWAAPVSRWDDGKTHFLAFTWKQFRENDANYLYTSYFVDGRPWNARVNLLGDQMVAPDPKAVWLGSLGGQPAGYDPSPPAPMDVRHFLVYKDALSPRGLLALEQQLDAGTGPAVTVDAAKEVPVTDSPLPERVVNGNFELGTFGWGGRFEDTIAGHPAHSWHGEPGTWIGVDQIWNAHGGEAGSAALTFALPGHAGKPISSDAFVLPPNQRFRLSCHALAEPPGAKVTLELKRHGAGEPTAATLEAAPGRTWQAFSQTVTTLPGENDWYSLVVTASGPDGSRVSLDGVSVAGLAVPPGQSRPAEVAVYVPDTPDGIVSDAAPIPLDIRVVQTAGARRNPMTYRVRVHDFFGHVFYDQTRQPLVSRSLLFMDASAVEQTPWLVPASAHGLCRVRVDISGPWGSSVAECPLTIVDHGLGSRLADPDSFWGSEWFPSDQANAVARRLGLRWIKMMNVGTGYGWWKTVEPQPGQWRWGTTPQEAAQENGLHDYGDHTDFVERLQALRNEGVLPMMTLVGAPDWANTEPPELGVHASFPKDRAAWDKAVRTIVGHYKGLVPAYEIWNEPGWWDNNLHLQKTKTYQDYAELVQTAITAIRETDPKALIVYQTYFNKMTDGDKALQRQILRQVDVWSTHNYFNDLPPDEDGTEQAFADTQAEAKASGNPHLQVWNTEGGVRAGGWHPFRSPDTLPFPRPAPFESRRRGAQFAKAAILMQAHGYAKWFYYISGGPVGGRDDPAPDDYSAWNEWGSYGTPTVAGGMSAVYAGLLHGAHYVRTIEKNARVRFFVFQTPQGVLTFYWGKNFGKANGEMSIPLAFHPSALDMMGNTLTLSQTAGHWNLPLTNLIYILRTPTVADAEKLVHAITLRSLPGNDFDVVLATPFQEKFAYAQTLAQEQWYQVDLSRQANRGFADDAAGDGKGGWTDEGPDNDLRFMPTGLLTLYGVPFRVIDPLQNNGNSCLVLRAGPGPGTRTNRPEFPHAITIPVGRKTNAFYFLVGIGWGVGTDAATLTVHYADGQAASIPLRNGINVLNWHDAPLPNADDHKFVPARKDRFLYAVQWINPRPTIPIQSLDFTSANATPIPILLSVTGHGVK